MAQKFIGLDLGTHEVKAVLVSAGLRTVQVLDVHEEAVVRGDEGDDSLEAALEVAISVLRKRGWSHYPVGVVLPGGVGSYRVLRFPFGDARRIAQAINFEVEGQFPVPVEELDIDHLVVSGTKHAGQALVAAVRKDLVKQVSERLAEAKIDIKAVTVPPLALGQVLDAPAPPIADAAAAEGRVPVALVVDIGHRNTELVAVGPKGPVAARSLRRGGHHVTRAIQRTFKIDAEEAEARKLRQGILPHGGAELDGDQARIAAVVAKAFEPLIREIEHTRLWLRTELDCEVTVVRLAGGGAGIGGLMEYLREQTGLTVEAAHPRESSTLKKVAGRDWSGATAALGAALGASRRPLIQLYTDGGSRGGEGSWLVERLSTVAMIGLAVLAFGALDTMAKMQAYELEEEAYATELAELTQRVFGQEITDVRDLEAKLEAVTVLDVTNLIQTRSALDAMSALFKAATPTGPKPQAEALEGTMAMGAAGPVAGGPSAADGSPLTGPVPPTDPASAMSSDDPDGESSSSSSSAPVDQNAGIVWDDELVFVAVEVRRQKIDLTASATGITAQSRLKRRLQMLSCVQNVQEGKLRDSNDRKQFEMSVEHDCLFKPLEEDA
ncbi:MAG: pilus assembly protein PilM [Myxococcales bacterium]|nr:pilus assembly protein PilM [Myxococcales bacterium]